MCSDSTLTAPRPSVSLGRVEGFRPFLSELGICEGRPADEATFTLVEREGRLDLRPPGESERPGIRADFPPDRVVAGATRSPLVRSFGSKVELILDLTAGLGADAYRLARAGYRVRASERDPAIYALLATGWAKDCAGGRVDSEVSERLKFTMAEGSDVLAGLDQSDVGVYLDPMYPSARRVKALPKRELQVLRQWLGEAVDAVELLDSARTQAARVVVKRPHRAPPLLPDVSFELSTKLVRFDVYINPERMGGERGE